MNFLTAAADLVSLGFKVFPLVPGRKVPLVDAWQIVATDDADVISGWAGQWPRANIGFVTGVKSDVLIIDVDMKGGKNGLATLAEMTKYGKVLPPSPISQTPTGGRHLYFRAVPGIKNVVEIQAGRGLGPGLDVRADGGFGTAPPSRLVECKTHEAGIYRWLIPPMSAHFPRLPDWAVKMLTTRPAPSRRAARIPLPHEAEGYRRQALADLHDLTSLMSAMSDGRHQAPFSKACVIGKYQAHGFLTKAEIEDAFLNASEANGALSKYAINDLASQIRNGLRKAQTDGLPPLARLHRQSGRGTTG